MEKKMKKVLIVCATSIATSSAIAIQLKNFCQKNGIAVEVQQAKGQDYYAKGNKFTEGFDLVITTINPLKDPNVPTILGVSLITGLGEEETYKKIKEVLSK
jgi:galactitol PTS system EIIB component